MFGIIIVTHGNFGKELLNTAEAIVGKMENIVSVPFHSPQNPETSKQLIQDAVKQVGNGKGIIILTDLFGGTPSNIAISFLNHQDIEVSRE